MIRKTCKIWLRKHRIWFRNFMWKLDGLIWLLMIFVDTWAKTILCLSKIWQFVCFLWIKLDISIFLFDDMQRTLKHFISWTNFFFLYKKNVCLFIEQTHYHIDKSNLKRILFYLEIGAIWWPYLTFV